MLQLLGTSTYALCKISDLFKLTENTRRGTAGLCVVAADLRLGVNFTSSRGECHHTTGLCFCRLVGTNLSVPYSSVSHRL